MSTLTMPSVANSLFEQELELIFRDHYQMLFRTAYCLLNNRADAEEVPQTIFLKLLRRGIPSDMKTNVRGYLYRAAVNLSLDMIRARKRRKLTQSIEGLETRLPAPQAPNSNADDEKRERLTAALSKLHPRTAEIVILRYVHDYSDAQIGELLGVSRGTMAMRLFRARARLKKLMQESSGEKR